MAAAVERQSPQSWSGPARTIILTCLMAGTLMQVLDSTVATVALPYMQGSMSASREQITWVLTSYVIASAIMTAPVGWIAARFGRKNFFVFSLIGFTIASALCGAARSLEEIVLFRTLQGAIGAALGPLSQSMMLDMYPPERRGQAMALFGTGIMVGPIMGPTLGGYLTDAFSWRWVFYVNVPVGIAAVAGLLLFPGRGLRDTSLRFDWSGFGLLALTLGALQLLLDRGYDRGWFQSEEIVLYGIVAGLGVYLFAVHLATSDKPLIPRALLSDRSFVVGFIGFLIMGQVMTASMAVLPPYLQALGGYTVLQTGLVMSPRGIGIIVAMQVMGLLGNRANPLYALCAGSIITALAIWQMAGWTPGVDLWTLCSVSAIQGFGLGLLFVPMNLYAFASLPNRLRTDGTAILNLGRNLGAAIGVAITSALIASTTQVARAGLAAHVTPFNRPLQLDAPSMMWSTALPNGAVAINAVIRREAEIIAYADAFIFLGALALGALFMVLFAKRPKETARAEQPAME